MNSSLNSRELSFRANAGLKDIIGRGLILDDNIAIIELIKNAKDAGSPKVKLHFKDATKEQPSGLVLKDFGHGMSLDDIRDKWLNIAYSEKKSANLKRKKSFAGSKGVGRFSCDRLGKELVLYTKSKTGDYIKLPINWELFEVNSIDAEISTVKLEYEILTRQKFLEEIDESKFSTGTVLKINELRSNWGDKQLLKLRSELEKFIFDPDVNFEIKLRVHDKPEEEITNTVFEELLLRTYNIVSSIDDTGKTLKTALRYQGDVIYEYEAENPYAHLKNIKVDAHFLNFPAKVFFKRRTGYSANDYGSIFMFLNGFRISPFGNPKNDWLGLDQRKSQGTSRYLGTRELIGKVSVIDQDEVFTPISSREGVVQDAAYQELTAYDPEQKVELTTYDSELKKRVKNGKSDYGFVPHVLRQLERFIVEGLKWHGLINLTNPNATKVISDKDLKRDPTNYALQPVDEDVLKSTIEKTLRTSNFDIEHFNINTKLISALSQEAEDAYNEYILSFIQNTTDKSFNELSRSDKGSLKKIALRNMEAIRSEKEAIRIAAEQRIRAERAELKAKEESLRAEEAERREEKAKEREALEREAKRAALVVAQAEKGAREKAEILLKESNDENIFHKLDANKNLDHIINLHHQIILYCSTAEEEIEDLKDSLMSGEKLSTEEILEYINSIENELSKISKFSEFATSQKYRLALASVNGNFVKFVSRYLDDLNERKTPLRRIVLSNQIDKSVVFETDYSPLNVMILVDNLISNSRRAGAKKVTFLPPVSKNGLFAITDNGAGLDSSISNPDKIFDKGFTTHTTGSGRGLYHVAETLDEMGLKMRILKTMGPSEGLSLEVIKNVD